MNLNTLFTVNIVVASLFGLGFVFAHEAMLAPYGVASETIAASAMMSKFFGASNLGYAVLFFFMRSAPDSDAKIAVAKAIVLGSLLVVWSVFKYKCQGKSVLLDGQQ